MKIKWRKHVGRMPDDIFYVGEYENFRIEIGDYVTVIMYNSMTPGDTRLRGGKYVTIRVYDVNRAIPDIKREKQIAKEKLKETIVSMRDEMGRYARDI